MKRQKSDYIIQTVTNRLGTGCLELSRSFARSRSLLRHARPVLETLATDLGETAHIGKLQEFEVLHLDAESASGLVVAGERLGQRLPAHCTALGKVLLAHGDQELRRAFDHEVAAGGGLAQRTPATINDRDKFFDHLRGVASDQLAFDLEECEAGLACAAAPVYDANEHVVAALSVSGPAFRLSEDTLRRDVAPALRQAAGELSRRLGYPQEAHGKSVVEI